MSEKHLELTLVWVPRAVTQALMPSDNPLPDVHVQTPPLQLSYHKDAERQRQGPAVQG